MVFVSLVFGVNRSGEWFIELPAMESKEQIL